MSADKRRLAGGAVLARRLAHRWRVAVRIEQVVGDLKGEAEIFAVTSQRRALRVGRASEHGARFARRGDQRARLQGLQPPHVRRRHAARLAALFRLEVEHLPEHHAASAGSVRQQACQLGAHAGIGVRLRSRP